MRSKLVPLVVVAVGLTLPAAAVSGEGLAGTTLVVVENLDPAAATWLGERAQALLVDTEGGRAVAALEPAPLEAVLRTLAPLRPRVTGAGAEVPEFVAHAHRLLGLTPGAPGVWGFRPMALHAPQLPAGTSDTLTTVAADDFEGPLLAGSGGIWQAWPTGSYQWGRTTCVAQSGDWSADPVRGGSAGAELCCSCSYPSTDQSWLYLDQSVSVEGLTDPAVRFSWRGKISSQSGANGPLDLIAPMVSIGGTWYGYPYFGDTFGQWRPVSHAMTNWHALGDLRQYGSFNFGFWFRATSYEPVGEGVRIDDFEIASSDSGGEMCAGIAGLPCDPGYYCRSTQEACFWMGADLAGTCTAIPGGCPTVYDPVCGCDGSTYSNACFAAAAGESVWYEGECSGQDCAPLAPGNPRVRDADGELACSSGLAIDGNEPVLLWDPVGGATAYGLQVFSQAASCDGTPWIDAAIPLEQFPDPSRPGVEFTSPLEDGDYCWRVRAEGEASAATPAKTAAWGCWTGCCCFAVDTSGGCELSVSPSSAEFPSGGGSGSSAVAASTPGCAWTASSDSAWITVTSGSSGTGDGTVRYQVAANSGGTRSGAITVSGDSSATISISQNGTSQWCGDGACDWWESVWGCPADCGLGDDTTGRAGGATRSGYVPAAVGGQEGVGGTYWLTEGFVLNPSASTARIDLSFTPDDSPGTSMPAGRINLPPDGVLHFDNLVHELWGVRDNGCIWLEADVPVMFTTRTYNQTASGTYGQSLGTVQSRMTLSPGDRMYLLGVSEDAAFRTNVVLQTVGDEAAEVRIIARRGSRIEHARRTLTVPGHAKVQRRLLDLGLGGLSNGYLVVESLSGGQVAVLGSVVDNITGDATTLDAVHAVQVGTRGNGKGALQERHYLVAVVAHKPGLNQTEWRSKVDILNPLGTTQTVRLEYHREGGGTHTTTVNIGSEEQVTFNDVVADLFPGAGDSGGSLHAFAPEGVLVSTRTYNQAVGTFGQAIPGLAEGDLLGPADTGVLLKLNNNAAVRCNVGFTEFSGAATQVAVVVYAPSAVSKIPLGAKIYNVAAGQNLHVTRAFDDIGVDGSHTGAWAEVSVVSGGRIYAYASNVDEVTGDAEFIAAQRK